MSQQPPTGPTPEPSDDDAPRTPDEGEGFARSPYDAPHTQPADATAAYPAAGYGQAPDPGRTIYSDASTTEPDPEPEPDGGRPRWVLPAVIAVVVLLVAGGIAAALLLGGDDEDPAASPTPTAEATTTPEQTEEPTEPATTQEPTDKPTAEPSATTDEPTEEPSSELLADLDETVSVGDLTFELSEEGFTPDDSVGGAVEAYRGSYVSGDETIEMRASLWPDNGAADAFAAEMVEAVDGEQVDTGDTYTNQTGTFWAFFLEDERGRYIWTTDRGHVLEITGSADYVSQFYASLPL
ncbi:hypothetical protein M3148_06445 [Georgenia satyanarayanai]|uniref:hypothetical protein n=1 Tax=Georgenia satyanarayanai TaxID=860221 RepID=UPI0020407190|nr:hypothetical protein [Georgenia satyanarayanai]MCM3660635.1 hypothetical protein [Georgenia satyanarayanai]